MLSFNGNKVIKEYYVNDHGSQIKNFVNSVYYRILEIKDNIPFPSDRDLYPGDYVIAIANKIISDCRVQYPPIAYKGIFGFIII